MPEKAPDRKDKEAGAEEGERDVPVGRRQVRDVAHEPEEKNRERNVEGEFRERLTDRRRDELHGCSEIADGNERKERKRRKKVGEEEFHRCCSQNV